MDVRDGDGDRGDLFQDFQREQWLEGYKVSREGILELLLEKDPWRGRN